MTSLLKAVAAATTGLAAAIGTLSAAYAQGAYPNRQIRMVLPFAPGGSSVNIIGRIVEQVLSSQLGVPVVIDNKSGAAGNIGAEYVAKSVPDGYTVLFSTASLISNTALHKNLSWSPLRDLSPVTMVYTTPALYVVSNSLPISTVAELVNYGRKNPGRIVYGSSGVGGQTHLAAQYLFDVLDIQTIHVPYKGTSQAMPDLISGRIHFFAAAPAAVIPYIKDKRIKALAVASMTRLRELPDTPSTHESVESNFEVGFWSGLWTPARTPNPVIDRLYTTLERYFLSSEGRAKLEAQGAIPVVSKPDEFSAFLTRDLDRWTKVIERSGIKPE